MTDWKTAIPYKPAKAGESVVVEKPKAKVDWKAAIPFTGTQAPLPGQPGAMQFTEEPLTTPGTGGGTSLSKALEGAGEGVSQLWQQLHADPGQVVANAGEAALQAPANLLSKGAEAISTAGDYIAGGLSRGLHKLGVGSDMTEAELEDRIAQAAQRDPIGQLGKIYEQPEPITLEGQIGRGVATIGMAPVIGIESLALGMGAENAVAQYRVAKSLGVDEDMAFHAFLTGAGTGTAGGIVPLHHLNRVTNGGFAKVFSEALVFGGAAGTQTAVDKLLMENLSDADLPVLRDAVDSMTLGALTGVLASGLAAVAMDRSGSSGARNESSSGERSSDAHVGPYTEFVGDSLPPKASGAKPDSLGEVPSKGVVLESVGGAGHDPKVLNPVVGGDSVDVVDNIVGVNSSAKSALHDDAVNILEPPAKFAADVSTVKTSFPLEVGATTSGAKDVAGSPSPSLASEVGAAGRTLETHGVAPQKRAVSEAGSATTESASTKSTVARVEEQAQTEPTPAASPEVSGKAEPAKPGGDAGSALPEKLTGAKHESVRKIREEMGLDTEKAEYEPITLKGAVERAAEIAQADPHAGTKLVDELTAKARQVEPHETALLTHEATRRRNEYNALQRESYKAREEGGDPEAFTDRIKAAREAFDKAADALDLPGSLQGQGLVARKMMMAEDYSYAGIERKVRDTNRGDVLSDKQRARIEAFDKELTALEQRAEALKQGEAQRETVQMAKRATRTTPARGSVRTFLHERANNARARIKARGTRLSAGADPLFAADVAIIGAEHIADGVVEFAEWSKKVVDEFGESVKPILQDVYRQALAIHSGAEKEAKRLESKKARDRRIIEKLQAKIDSGDFGKPERPKPIQQDEASLALEAEKARLRKQIDEYVRQQERKNRSAHEKAVDFVAGMRRAFVLSSPSTIAKLTAAGAQRLAFTPLEEAVGAGIGKAFPKLAEKAPRQGGFSVSAEVGALRDAVTKGMRDGWDMMVKGHSDIDAMYGRDRLHDGPLAAFFGRMHGALKAPVKRAEFSRSFAKRAAWAEANGYDLQDQATVTRIALDAYKDGAGAIFMQDNRVVDAWNRALHAMEAKDKETGKVPVLGKVGAGIGRVVLPIVRIPTNVVAETFQYALGAEVGAAKLARAYAKGIDNLSEYEADTVLKLLKKGAVGSSVMALGYFAYKDVGGYYQPNKKDDQEPGSVKVFGVEMPSLVLHNPTMEQLQIGATLRQVAETRKKGESEGVGAGTLAAAFGLLEEVPFLDEMKRVGELMDERLRPAAGRKFVGDLVVPQGIQWLARKLDGETKRKPRTLMEEIKSRIPGLRESVPLKGAKGYYR